MILTKKETLSYTEEIERLIHQRKIAQIKYAKRKLKLDIIKLYLPHFHFQFNKFIVLLCIVAIVLYTLAAFLLQKYTMVEISPTLTTCVFAFFGTELLGLAGIKCFDIKCNNNDINNDKLDIIASQNENVDIDNDAVG